MASSAANMASEKGRTSSAVPGTATAIVAEKLGVDPAVMANPLISTLTDAVSLLIYIYVAKLILNI